MENYNLYERFWKLENRGIILENERIILKTGK